jgi:hypothetical protein
LNDELKKLGLRIRHRTVGTATGEKPGKVGFDERGNAIYQWSDDRLDQDGETGERLRDKALDYVGLAIADDDAPISAPIRANPKGTRIGYNPYESGLLTRKEPKRKRDLRELSRWIDAKRKLNENKDE